MYQRAILFLPGEVETSAFKAFFSVDDYIIAVDGGIELVERFMLTPHIWIGDFDSTSQELLERYQSSIPREKYPSDKNELDTELALNRVINQGISQVLIIGGIGGRLDHQLAISLLPLQYRELYIGYTDGINWFYTLTNKIKTYKVIKGELVSLIPLEDLKEVSIEGVKWMLNREDLFVGRGRSISNVAVSNEVAISCRFGRGWVYIKNYN